MKTFIERLQDNLALAEREGDHWSAGRIQQTIDTLTKARELNPHVKRARKLFVPQKEMGA
jgi:hypothetical protein